MGSTKEIMFESPGLLVSFKCPDQNCSGIVEDHVEDASFDWTSDSMRDGIGTAESEVLCPKCNERFLVEVAARGGAKEVSVLDHPETKVDFNDNTFEYTDYEKFLADYEPNKPHEVFNQSMMELNVLDIDSQFYGKSRFSLTKMLYLQYVVVLEAYLSDRLIRMVSDDIGILPKIVGATAGLRDQEFKLIEATKDPDFVKKKIKVYLQNLSFHNLSKIAPIYRATLKCDLFGSEEIRMEMLEIIEMRHHLVHRNGRDSDGNAVVISDQDVKRVKKLVTDIVTRVETAYNFYLSNRIIT